MIEDLFPKWILEDGDLIIMKVKYHRDIVTKDRSTVKGGGWFGFNSETKTFRLFGDSHDFGKANIEDVKVAILNDRVFTNSLRIDSIANKWNWTWDTGSELIPLNQI